MNKAEAQLDEAHYQRYRNERIIKDVYRTSFMRMFFPNKADWTVKSNPWVGKDRTENYEPLSGKFPRLSNNFADHEQN